MFCSIENFRHQRWLRCGHGECYSNLKKVMLQIRALFPAVGLGRQKSATPLATGEPEGRKRAQLLFRGPVAKRWEGSFCAQPHCRKLESSACAPFCTRGSSVAHYRTATPSLWGSACATRFGKSASEWPRVRFWEICPHRLSGKITHPLPETGDHVLPESP